MNVSNNFSTPKVKEDSRNSEDYGIFEINITRCPEETLSEKRAREKSERGIQNEMRNFRLNLLFRSMDENRNFR